MFSVELEPELAAEIRQNVAANPGLLAVTVVTGVASDDLTGDHVTIDDLATDYFMPSIRPGRFDRRD